VTRSMAKDRPLPSFNYNRMRVRLHENDANKGKCQSRAGVWRQDHGWDKDGRYVFCDLQDRDGQFTKT